MLFKIDGTTVITMMLSLISILFSHLTYAKECRIEGYSYAIDCIELRAQDERGFSINVFQVPATVRYPHPEPIVWIPDGLVLKPSERAPTMISMLNRVRGQRNLVWLEIEHPQKNTLLACNPDLYPPKFKVANISNRIDPLHSDEILENCKNKLQLVDANVFTYENIAANYEYSRKKLGLKQVIVVAEGRGAEIALAWHRLAPDSIRFAVLDSPSIYKYGYSISQATAQDRSLQAVFLGCQQSETCNKNNPNLAEVFLTITKSLPQTISLKDPLTMQSASFIMDESLFLQSIQFLLRSPSRAKTLPLLLSKAHGGDWQPFVGMLSMGWYRKMNGANLGLYMIETCKRYDASEADMTHGLAGISAWFFNAEQNRLNRLCGAHNNIAQKISTPFNAPVLILSGGVNPSNHQDFSMFQHKTLLHVKNAGASLIGYGCTKDVVYRYFKAVEHFNSKILPDDKSLEASCITQIPYPSMDQQPFFLRGEQ